MQHLAIFTTADGEEVTIQVADEGTGITHASPDVVTRGIPTGQLIERTHRSLDDALRHARPAVTSLLRQVREQDDPPDELEVEFGIQVSLEVGAYIAAASSSANFRVTMRWMSRPG